MLRIIKKLMPGSITSLIEHFNQLGLNTETLDSHDVTTTTHPIDIGLDLDHTLVLPLDWASDPEELSEFETVFRNLNLEISYAFFLHVVLPGALELIQYLYEQPSVRVFFFSAGHEVRNEILIHDLLLKALGPDKGERAFQEIKREERIFSRNNLNFRPGLPATKDLFVINSDLNRTIFIDDEKNYIYKDEKRDQHQNFLLTTGCKNIDILEDAVLILKDNFNLEHRNTRSLRHVNHLFFVTGLLKEILDSKNKNLSNDLYQKQYPDSNFLQLHDEHDYYLKGLNELRTVNSEMTFFGGPRLEKFFQEYKKMFTPRKIQNVMTTRSDSQLSLMAPR